MREQNNGHESKFYKVQYLTLMKFFLTKIVVISGVLIRWINDYHRKLSLEFSVRVPFPILDYY